MASSALITASVWKVEMAIFGPPVPSCRLRPGSLISGPIVSRCKPIRAAHYHCPNEGHNDRFRERKSGSDLQHSFSLRLERSIWWPGKVESFLPNLSKGFATVVNAGAGIYTSKTFRRRLVLISHAEKGTDSSEITRILTAECNNPDWKPQLCYVSTGVNIHAGSFVRVEKGFKSHGFEIPAIQKKLNDDLANNRSPLIAIETILIIGTSTKDQFDRAVKILTGKESKIPDKRPYVARLQTSEPSNYWHRVQELQLEWELK